MSVMIQYAIHASIVIKYLLTGFNLIVCHFLDLLTICLEINY